MSTLAITRSLGQRGLRVLVASPEQSPIAGCSRYCAACFRYPDPSRDTAEFLDYIDSLVGEHRPDLLIPVTEKTLIPIAENRQRFVGRTQLAIAADASLKTVLNKQATAILAESLGIATPKSLVAGDQQQLLQCAGQIGFPLVLKPIRSISRKSGAVGPQLAVTYAFDREELGRVAQPLLEHGEVVIQEYFRGEGVGVEVIADRGLVYYQFQHRRLHEMPLSGGGSCLRESVPVDPTLSSAACRLMQALDWHGVAMIEFKRDPGSGEYRLIEINGRFWGSLPVSRVAGVDFPWLTWQLFVHGEQTRLPAAAVGVKCRDLGKDLYWHEYVLRRVTDERLFSYPDKGRLLRDLLQLFSPRHHLDSFYWRDPRPALIDLTRIVRHYGGRVRGQWRRWQRLRAQRHAWQSGKMQQALAASRQLLILCYGNINRSAVAHAYLQQTYGDRLAVNIESAGFHPQPGRPADPNMVAVARSRGIDLEASRSSVVSAAQFARADMILVMDESHLQRVAELAPSAMARTFLWAAPLSHQGEPIEIDDPYGKAIETYQSCFDTLCRAADQLVRSMPASPDRIQGRPRTGMHNTD